MVAKKCMKGGGLGKDIEKLIERVAESKIFMGIVIIIAILNIVGLGYRRDYSAIGFFILACVLMALISKNLGVVLFFAIIALSIYSASNRIYPKEGLTNKNDNTSEKVNQNVNSNQDNSDQVPMASTENTLMKAGSALDWSALTGMNSLNKENFQDLVNRQEDLMKMAKNLQPMVEQSLSIIGKLPPGTLENAMNPENHKKMKKQLELIKKM